MYRLKHPRLSSGIEPERGQVACTCSKCARWLSQRGSLGTSDQLRRSCSTFGLGCSHLELLGKLWDSEEGDLRDMCP
jgi:hypothetical protein